MDVRGMVFVAVRLPIMGVIMVKILFMLVIAIVVFYHKVLLFRGCIIMAMIIAAVCTVNVGGTVSVGVAVVLGGAAPAGRAQQAQNGQKEKQFFHGDPV